MKDLPVLSQRIERVRKTLNLSKGELAEFLQIKPSAYSQILSRGVLSEIHLERLKTLKNVNTDFLNHGTLPEIFIKKTETFSIKLTNVNKIEIQVQKDQDLHPNELLITVEYC